WGVKRIGAGLVHDSYNNGDRIKIAIIDTGIDEDHPDLDDNIKGGINFVSKPSWRTPDPNKWDDDNGHGTHVAGIIAAEDNDSGVVGVAPGADLYALKVLDRTGSGYVSDVVMAIQWATENDIQVINMSLGGAATDLLWAACWLAYEFDGLILVAAAGNGGAVIYPAAYDSVIAVSATNSADELAWFSSTGSEVELAAPGVEIYSTLPTYECTLSSEYGYEYGVLSGTSMACPHVVGAAALVWAANPGWNNDQVRNQLTSTAKDIGLPSNEQGYGLVNCAAALGLDEEVDITPPNQVTGLSATAFSSSRIDLSWTSNSESDLSYYNIYRDNSLEPISTTINNNYSDISLNPSTTYNYNVSAVDTSGNEGLLSNTVPETTYPFEEDKKMYVKSISFDREPSKPRDNLKITVKVVDDSSEPLSNVEVMMNLSWILTNNKTGSRDFNSTTGNSGEVTFKLMKARSGDYTATITGLTLSGYIWNAGQGITDKSYTLSK
ncbi:MAG: S8 family serine peptidase, partial [Candidatus Marinimicrobia bacterium]|nr:S8 family serine peptidase [Candidatus Neomarinimicrobiota bacterium]